MSLSFLKIIVRKVSKTRFNALIKLLGLVTGITAFLVISSWVISEKSYDNFWQDKDLIYRVSLKKYAHGTFTYQSAKNFYGAAQVLKNEIPEIEASTNLREDIVTIFTPENSVQDIRMFYADNSFFSVFSLSLQTNTPGNPFPDFKGAIISKSLAGKLFGDAPPLNQKFKVNEGWEFYVSGVFDDFPGKSHLDIDLLIYSRSLSYYLKYFDYSTGRLNVTETPSVKDPDPYNKSTWQTPNSYTYIKLNRNADPVLVEKKAAEVLKTYTSHLAEKEEYAEFIHQPVQSIYLSPPLEGELPAKGNEFRIFALAVISVLILFISWFNYANLSVAEAMKSVGSSGIRRSMGAGKTDLFFEHFAETLIFHLLSGILSLAIVVIALQNGLHTDGLNIPPVHFRFLGLTCFIVTVAGALVSEIIPFFMLMRTSLLVLLRGKKISRFHRQSVWNAMLGFQFMAAILLIVSTVMIYRQISLMVNKELGFNMDQVVVSYSPMTMNLNPAKNEKQETFRDEILRIPSVISFTTTAAIPGRDPARYSDNVRMQEQISNKGRFALLNVGEDYFNFFSIKKLYGRVFEKEDDYDAREIVINWNACLHLGIDDLPGAIDKIVYINELPYRLIGIVDDFHQKSLREEIAPAVFFKSLKWNYEVGFYCIKVSPDHIATTVEQLRETWNRIYPGEPYLFSFLDDEFNALYNSDVAFGRVFAVFSFLAVLMAATGLFAFVKFSFELKIKEIGIRKVNGATVGEIMIFLNSGYVKMIACSFLVAVPLAWYAMQKWLQNFTYKTSLSWWIFLLAGILVLGIALLTVGWQSWKTAMRNPVESLRFE
jgi:putative ABC transport system permease protein